MTAATVAAAAAAATAFGVFSINIIYLQCYRSNWILALIELPFEWLLVDLFRVASPLPSRSHGLVMNWKRLQLTCINERREHGCLCRYVRIHRFKHEDMKISESTWLLISLFHFIFIVFSATLSLFLRQTPRRNLWGFLYRNSFIQFSLWNSFLLHSKEIYDWKIEFSESGRDLLTVSKLIRPIIIDILFDKNQVFISQVYRIPNWYGASISSKKKVRTNESE